MEKLLETGKYMHPFQSIQGLKKNEHLFPLNRKSENDWRLQLFDQELGNIVTQGERHPGRKPGGDAPLPPARRAQKVLRGERNTHDGIFTTR